MKRASEAAEERKKLERELAAELRKKDRARLRALREDIVRAREARKASIASARQSCAAARADLNERAKLAREALREAIKLERAETRGSCAVGRQSAREKGTQQVTAKRGELARERDALRTQRLYEKPASVKGSSRSTGGRRAAELRAESDDEVRANLPPELVAVFDSVRRSIAPTAKRTRTETFLEWAAEHPERVYEITDRKIADDLRRLEREEREHYKRMQGARRYRGKAHELEQALADVPF